jgi:8-oxo-dGTP pyrophosphatase MutT (NUDIX family)
MAQGGAQEERSAGGIVYRMEDGAPRVLLIRDSYRNWGFPKGHVKEGEDEEEAARREVREETGLDGLTVRADAGTIDWFFRFRGRLVHKYCRFYVMEASSARTKPQAEEGITDCRWLEPAAAMEKLSYDNAREVLKRALELI